MGARMRDARLGRHAAWAARRLAAEPAHRRPDPADLALRHVDGLGAGADLLLQRRLSADARRQAALGARRAVARGLGGDLARYRPAHRHRARDRRGDLGRRPAAVPGAQRLSARKPTTPSPTARSPTTTAASPACSASSPRRPSASSASGGLPAAARPRRRAFARANGGRRLSTALRAALAGDLQGPAVHADLPVRAGRRRRALVCATGGLDPADRRLRRRIAARRGRWPVATRSRAAVAVDHRGAARLTSSPLPPAPGTRRRRGRVLIAADRAAGPGAAGGLPGRRPQSVIARSTRLSRLLDLRRRPDRRRPRQCARLRGGAPARRGAGRDRPRQDRVLLQRQPRIPHAADADAGAAGGRCWREPAAALLAARAISCEIAHRNGLRLLKLVNTLLDFSRIEAGRARRRPSSRSILRRFTRGSRLRLPLGDANSAGLRLSIDCSAARCGAGLCRPRHVGEDRLNLLPTRSSSPSRARSRSLAADGRTAC